MGKKYRIINTQGQIEIGGKLYYASAHPTPILDESDFRPSSGLTVPHGPEGEMRVELSELESLLESGHIEAV